MFRGVKALYSNLTTASKRRFLRVASIGLDLQVVLTLILIRLQAQVREQPDPSVLGSPPPPEWWWKLGWLGDWVLYPGPDAGNWAIEMQKWITGLEQDYHRPPVFTLLGGMATSLFGDVVFAGHMVNHLLSLLLCFVTYALGRATSGRGPALAAALLVATYPDLITDKARFGVDPTQQLAILTLALFTWWAAQGRLWRLLPAGLAVGFAAASHFLSMAFAVPAALMMVLSDPPWRRYVPSWLPRGLRVLLYKEFAWKWLYRLTAPVAALGIGYLTWILLMSWHPPVSILKVMEVYSEAITDMSGEHKKVDITLGQAANIVLERLDGTPAILYERVIKPWAKPPLPWQLLIFFWGLGLLGPGLRKSRHKSWISWDWRPGLWLTVFLVPMVGMAASNAPLRYFLWAIPIIFLAMARGVASLATGVEYLLRRWAPGWPRGLLAMLVCTVAGIWMATRFSDHWPLRFRVDPAVLNRRIGQMVQSRFGPGKCIVTPSQEQLLYSQRFGFLAGSCAPGSFNSDLATCLSLLLFKCPTDKEIPYVMDNSRHSTSDRPHTELRALVVKNFKLAGEVKYKQFSAKIYRIKRAQLAAELQRLQ